MKNVKADSKLNRWVAIIGLVAGMVQIGIADPNPPQLLTYQGFIEDDNGDPIATTPTNYDVIFRIYENETATAGEEPLWSEIQTVTFDNGVFSVMLGAGSAYSSSEPYPPLSEVFDNLDAGSGSTVSSRYLGITILGLTGGNDSEMSPRLRYLTTPFSFLANKALVADSLSASDFTINSTSGDVTIAKKLNVTGVATFSSALTAPSVAATGAGSFGGALSAGSISTTGNATVGGDLSVGDITASGDVNINGAITARGTSWITGGSSFNGDTQWDGWLSVGGQNGASMAMDQNEIQAVARPSGIPEASKIYVNARGGDVSVGKAGESIVQLNGDVKVGNADSTVTLNGNLMLAGSLQDPDSEFLDFQRGIKISNAQMVLESDISSFSGGIFERSIHLNGTDDEWLIGTVVGTKQQLHFVYRDPTGSPQYAAVAMIGRDGQYSRISDRRAKKNIEPVDEGVLEKLMTLKPVKYHMNYQADEDEKGLGFIAQEVEKSFPGVPNQDDGWYSLDYDNFSVLAVSAIQELRKEKDQEIEELKEKNIQLESEKDALARKYEDLEARLKALENLLSK